MQKNRRRFDSKHEHTEMHAKMHHKSRVCWV